jgi:hypothetical protein
MMLMVFVSCNKDVSDEFLDANGNVAQKYIKRIEVISAQDPLENKTITVSYDGNNRVSSISDGATTSIFVYENNELSTITGDGDPFDIVELYQAPYDADETGDILEYDANGNPRRILILDEFYDGSVDELTGELTYDVAPNPFFYTLEAGGLIEVMDKVKFNFSMAPQPAEIVRARMLFPLNNLNGVIFKDQTGAIKYDMRADYVYNEDNYPSSATFTVIDENETGIYTATYFYR